MDKDEAHLDRSQMIGRQKKDRTELEKKVKKLKGALKEAAQKELEELDTKHEAELKKFDGQEGTGKTKAAPANDDKEDAKAAIDYGSLRERQWNGLSKKELEECCTERGISKKGAKEDLIMRCNSFHQELAIKKKEDAEALRNKIAKAQAAEEEEEEEEEEEDDEARAKRERKEKRRDKKEKKEKKIKDEEEGEEGEEGEEDEEAAKAEEERKKAKKEKKERREKERAAEEDEEAEEPAEVIQKTVKKEKKPAASSSAKAAAVVEDEDGEDEEDSDDDDDDGLDVDEEEMERQAKREKAVQQALKFLLTKKCPEGFALSEFEAKLEMINVKGFDPEKLGYRSVEKFCKLQPPNVLQYDKAKKWIEPPRKKGEAAI